MPDDGVKVLLMGG